MGIVCKDDGRRMPDALWAEIQPLLPPPKSHPYGGQDPRVDDRAAMDAISFVLRTGWQWHALDATKACSEAIPALRLPAPPAESVSLAAPARERSPRPHSRLRRHNPRAASD